MSESLKEDLLAARIKHVGACPNYKGHAVDSVASAIFATFTLTVTGLLLFASLVLPNREREAIEHGFATRDPVTFHFEWKSR